MTNLFTQPTQAMKMLRTTLARKQELTPRIDARATADVLETIPRMIDAKYELMPYVVPSGTAGTPPDADPILLSVFGTKVTVGGTSVTYSPNSAQISNATAGTGSFSALREYNSIMAQQMIGCWADVLKITLKGGDEPKFSISGGCQNAKTTGSGALTAGASSGASVVNVGVAAARNFYPASGGDAAASLIDIGTNDPNHTVTAVNYGTGDLTISPVLANTQVSGAAVVPHVPTETTLGSPISFTLGSVQLDGTTISGAIVGADIEYGNVVKPFRDVAFTAVVPDYIKSFRKATGTLTFKSRSDLIAILGQSEQIPQTNRAIILQCGTAAGRIMTINLATVVIFEPENDVPETDEGHIKAPFIALGSGIGDNSMTLVFT